MTNIPLDKALETYLEALTLEGRGLVSEKVGVNDACGRITSKAVYANASSPHYNSSAMDGLAIQAEITFGATETTPVTLTESDYLRVDTGDPIPKGCNCVVMIEEVVEPPDAPGNILLYQAATPWQHIRQIGEDISMGDMIVPSFTKISPSAAGALAAGGALEIDVIKKPLVGIIPTGDEIVPPSESLKEGDIAEFNSIIFTGMLESRNAEAKTYPIVKDKLELITEAINKATSECDVVLIIAGTSAGTEDFSSMAIAKLGKIIHHGIAIKPGKPAILGLCEGVPVIGVPGYPVSGIIVLEKIVCPIINKMLFQSTSDDDTVEAVLSRRINSTLKYQEFVRARLGIVNGKLVASPLARGAGVITSFVKADCLIDVPQNLEGYESGDILKVNLLRPQNEIDNTLVVTGSHDPLIDEAADLLRRKFHNSFLASSHAGSMGGIMAVKRGEAHLAGIHLLDEDTGEYNRPFVNKHFPEGAANKAVLLPCVKRVQGFILPKGNPKGVAKWDDIRSGKLSYVNRQKGSGTRILCDYLLKKNGISTNEICDYDREEYTHTGVAAIVASGSADVGLGIYSSAKIYGLDFVPVYEEQYDFLIAGWAVETEIVRRFIDIIASQEFLGRLELLGGYIKV